MPGPSLGGLPGRCPVTLTFSGPPPLPLPSNNGPFSRRPSRPAHSLRSVSVSRSVAGSYVRSRSVAVPGLPPEGPPEGHHLAGLVSGSSRRQPEALQRPRNASTVAPRSGRNGWNTHWTKVPPASERRSTGAGKALDGTQGPYHGRRQGPCSQAGAPSGPAHRLEQASPRAGPQGPSPGTFANKCSSEGHRRLSEALGQPLEYTARRPRGPRSPRPRRPSCVFQPAPRASPACHPGVLASRSPRARGGQSRHGGLDHPRRPRRLRPRGPPPPRGPPEGHRLEGASCTTRLARLAVPRRPRLGLLEYTPRSSGLPTSARRRHPPRRQLEQLVTSSTSSPRAPRPRRRLASKCSPAPARGGQLPPRPRGRQCVFQPALLPGLSSPGARV